MKLLEIPVGELLNNYNGYSKDLEFSGEIQPQDIDGLKIKGNLEVKIKLIRIEGGVELIIQELKCMLDDENKKSIEIQDIEREFREKYEKGLPDDVGFINHKNCTINIATVIKEEILISSIY